MSIKKQWLSTMIFITFIAIIINSSLYSILIDKNFVSYIAENYQNEINEIQEYSKYIMKNDSISKEQIQMEMQKYLDDPISEIVLYKPNGEVLISVETKGMGMMHRQRIDQNIGQERDEYNIIDGEDVIGKLIVTRRGSVKSSATSIIFKTKLFINSLIAGGIVLLIAILVSILISRRTTKDLIDTANFAKALDVNEETKLQYSSITEVKEIQNSLTLLSTKLKLKGKSRKQKIDTIIHQARTPLTIIKSNLEGAKDGVITLDEKSLESCINQVDILTNVISNLNEIIEIEQEKEPLKIETIDVVEEIKKIIKGFKIQFQNRNIRLSLLGQESQFVSTDKYLLTQGIYNILTNAYKFTQNGGTVQLIVEDHKDTVDLIVQDDGIGIPEENLHNIFNAYYRSPNAVKIPGQGLGLFVLQNNIERIEGKVKVISEIGKGTTFRITIPKSLGKH